MKLYRWLGIAVFIGGLIWISFQRGNAPTSPNMTVKASRPKIEPSLKVQALGQFRPSSTLIDSSVTNIHDLQVNPSELETHEKGNANSDSVFRVNNAGLIIDREGNLARVSPASAAQLCGEHGMRLPTIRELVTWGGRLLEVTEADKEVADGFRKEHVSATNPDGKNDEFYNVYDGHTGYTHRKGEWGNNWFWSSSVTASTHEIYSFNDDMRYVSKGVNWDDSDPFQYSAVRCVVRR